MRSAPTGRCERSSPTLGAAALTPTIGKAAADSSKVRRLYSQPDSRIRGLIRPLYYHLV
jgi:hypothetical protein